MTRWERAIVVGASSGTGAEIARRLAREGTAVALLARRADALRAVAASCEGAPGRCLLYPHDVRDVESVPGLFQQIASELGGLDLVVYAAGVQPTISASEYPTSEDMETIAVNLAGAVAWLNQAAMRFGRAGTGTIVGVSSVAGDRGRRGNPVYGAAKAALAHYLEALYNRLSARGVRVVTVKPGFVATRLLEGKAVPNMPPTISPERAAEEILRAAERGTRVAYIPPWWRYVMWVIRAVPSPLFKYLNV